MPYVVGRENRADAALKRLDHLICRVPDIEFYHRRLREIGFPEAWPVGRFWPEGRTSGIGLGGLNLELIQPDEGAPSQPICDTLVFEPVSLEAGEQAFARLGYRTERYEKWESDPELLKMRGFSEEGSQTEQLICKNLYPDPTFPVPLFMCEYSNGLARRLGREQVGDSPAGPVLAIEVQMEKPGQLWVLAELGYLGSVELIQREEVTGPFQIAGIKLERGPLDTRGVRLGFVFI